jgi:hypothetical protein
MKSGGPNETILKYLGGDAGRVDRADSGGGILTNRHFKNLF